MEGPALQFLSSPRPSDHTSLPPSGSPLLAFVPCVRLCVPVCDCVCFTYLMLLVSLTPTFCRVVPADAHTQVHDLFLVLDLEATCTKVRARRRRHEGTGAGWKAHSWSSD